MGWGLLYFLLLIYEESRSSIINWDAFTAEVIVL